MIIQSIIDSGLNGQQQTIIIKANQEIPKDSHSCLRRAGF